MQDTHNAILQALVYDTLPSTTAVFNYATGSRKLSANGQFFVGVVSLLQTTQIISDVCLITDHDDYAISPNFFFLSFLRGEDASIVYVRAWALVSFHNLISTQNFQRALIASLDSCAEIKSAPSVA